MGVKAGSTGTLTVRNPWPGHSVDVVDGGDQSTVIVAATTASQFSIPTTSGHSYLVQQVAALVSGMAFAQVTGTPATTASHLGIRLRAPGNDRLFGGGSPLDHVHGGHIVGDHLQL